MRTAAIAAMIALLGAAGLEAQSGAPAPRNGPVRQGRENPRAGRENPRAGRENPRAGRENPREARAREAEQPDTVRVPVTVLCCVPYYIYAPYGYLPYGSSGASSYVGQAPPPMRPEVPGPRPRPATAWIPGHWQWTGASYVWVNGEWVPIPPGYTAWQAGSWEHNQHGYWWMEGYWR